MESSTWVEHKLTHLTKAQPSKSGSQETHISTSDLVVKLKQCGKRKDLQCGKLLHCKAVDSGRHKNIYVANTLISMYSKCSRMQDAKDVFLKMPRRDVVSWTALIVGYVENGECSVALDVFYTMECAPNRVTFVAALRACTGLSTGKNLEKGVSVHRQAEKLGFDKDVVVANTLVDMYSKCREMLQARCVFDAMNERNAISWTALIRGYVENGQSLMALEVFERMDCAPDAVTFVAAVKACVGLEREICLHKGVSLHRQARELGFDNDVAVGSTFIDMYRKCGDMLEARRVFDGLVYRDVISWTALILGYVENGQSSVALDVFNSMDCAPDSVTYVAALKACAGLSKLEMGVSVHRRVRERGFDKHVLVANTVMDMYSKCGDMVEARRVFDGMMQRSVVSWNVLILGYVENGQRSIALDVFDSMDCVPDAATLVAAVKACAGLDVQKAVSVHKRARELGFDKDVVVANTLIDVYSKCGGMVHARGVFDGMIKRDVVSWNVLILGYVENGQSFMALEVFQSMDCSPDRLTLVAALKACACLGALEAGQAIHDRVSELGMERDEMVSNCLVDFYGKCGNMAGAEHVFNRMRVRDTVSWNALIGGYSSLGDVERVFGSLKRMQESGGKIDGVTVLLVLTVCSHTGMLKEGQECFETMSRYGVNPTMEHYACMVDILGNANKLDEALLLVRRMPFVANSVVWTALLGACRKWSNMCIGKVAFGALVDLNEDRGSVAGAYVLMRNIYERLGMQEEGEQIEAERKQALSGWKAYLQ